MNSSIPRESIGEGSDFIVASCEPSQQLSTFTGWEQHPANISTPNPGLQIFHWDTRRDCFIRAASDRIETERALEAPRIPSPDEAGFSSRRIKSRGGRRSHK